MASLPCRWDLMDLGTRTWRVKMYPLVICYSLPWKDPPCLIGTSSINGPLSIAILNNQRVYESIFTILSPCILTCYKIIWKYMGT